MLEIIELITDLGSTVMIIGLAGLIVSGLPYLILKDNIKEPSTVIDNLKTGVGFSALCAVAGAIIIVLALLIFVIVDIWK